MELFETFDEHGALLVQVPRDEVHARGLWHKAAQVFLFNSQGQLLIQHRALDKDLYAGLWDHSVGEHLLPGETFIQAAVRGLVEELGVHGVVLSPVSEVRKVELVMDGKQDREIQQAFSGVFDGDIKSDPKEVIATQYIELGALESWLDEQPEQFTPWFLQDLKFFGYL